MKEQRTCGLCGAPHPLEELHPFDGLELCAHCLDQRTLVCRHCGERIWAQDNVGSGEAPLCQACYDDHYTNCCRCGALLHESQAYYAEDDDYDEYPYCSDCFHTLPNASPIHDYYYKPTPVFHGTGPRFFGVELEIDGAGELLRNARSLLEIGNRDEDCLYIKHDGSLDDGLELVTHPASLDYQLRHVPWTELCRKAVSLGYLSHRANTCGLHIHVSREAFGAESWEQDLAIARVLYFFEKHWEELLKFSRRTPRQLERWAARYGYKEQPMEILDYAKKGYHGGRYTCVNLQNTHTVEFRMFRGTLKANTIFATLQMLDRICDAAIFLSDDEIKSLAWTTFVSGIQQDRYPELVQYLKERRLYVNEPVESEVED
ncbi:amidoligase family protein [Pseudoflavonifractor phocaeensis]|uniref:amidoligase family protein n=1 Tax=Pseudoflavonifractor phocaeensis TaxID=1870988 RepID=UPI00195A1B9A|nr:amidoligase family protein [Pseudoflavonifractor phocaeensis]MBM6926836.1 amidoligase family protein [Pseudoflavonifractor phocaeensis]